MGGGGFKEKVKKGIVPAKKLPLINFSCLLENTR